MKKNNNSVKFFMIVILALVCICTTGCGKDDVANAANSAKETVVNTASDTREKVEYWTRHTDTQSWTNSTGTRIEIKERRKEGDFEIKVTYSKETLNDDNKEGVKPTGDATVIMYVDHISEELMDELQTY